MINETIEEKTYRLMAWLYGAQPPFKTIKQTNDFKLRCQMLELAIAEEREANGWISVKDRMPTQYVLLSVRLTDSGKHVIRRGCYIKKFDEETYDEDHFDYNEADETNYVPEGWYELIANWDNYTSVFINEGVVTHWMELPAAPKDEVSE